MRNSSSLDPSANFRDHVSAEAAVSVLLDCQQGCWPLTTRAGIASEPIWVTTPEEVFPLLGRMDYIAPWGFSEQRRDKAHAVARGNLLWLDLDPPTRLLEDKLAAWLDAKRESLLSLLPAPTVCLSSGRGEWLYWKLNDSISKADFERVNRLLPQIAGSADTGSWSPEHWARLPGSINEKSGEMAFVRSISERRYQAHSLVTVIESAARVLGIDTVQRESAATSGITADVRTAAASRAPTISLPPDLEEYVRANPDWDQAHCELGIDRSACDQRIVAYAVNQHRSDGEIKAWFEAMELRRYVEEQKRGRSDNYLARALTKARNGWKPSPSSSLECVYTGSDHKQQESGRKGRKHIVPEAVLKVVREHEGAGYKEMQQLVAEAMPCSLVTARRRLKQLENDRYITLEQVAGRGGPKRVVLAQRGMKVFTPSATPMERMLKTVRTRPMGINRRKNSPAPTPTAKPKSLTPATTRVSDQTQISRLVRRLERDQIGPCPRISFAGRPKKTYLQVLTPFEEIQTSSVQVYEQVKVAYGPMIGSARLPIFRTFIDTTWTTMCGEEVSEDPFGERFLDEYTRHRFLAVAAMFEPSGDGLRLATIDHLDDQTGELCSLPAVGLLLEGIDFWQGLFEHPDLYEGCAFQAVRHGKRPSRIFNFTPTDHTIDLPLPGRAIIDRDQVIRDWSDVDAQRRWVEQMPPDWVPYIVRDPYSPYSDFPRAQRNPSAIPG